MPRPAHNERPCLAVLQGLEDPFGILQTPSQARQRRRMYPIRSSAAELSEDCPGDRRRHRTAGSALSLARGRLHDPATSDLAGFEPASACQGPHPLRADAQRFGRIFRGPEFH